MAPNSGKRIHRPRRSNSKSRFVAGLIILLCALAAVAAVLDYHREMEHRRANGVTEPPPAAVVDISADAGLAAGDRPIYPYSIIPGGITSVEELKSAIAHDPLVAAHYKDFEVSKARVERLETPKFAHVSYRMANRVYWTRQPVVLPAGERVVTDGRHIARTRCGNQLEAEAGPTSPAEPPAVVLDSPLTPGRLPAQSVAAALPVPAASYRGLMPNGSFPFAGSPFGASPWGAPGAIGGGLPIGGALAAQSAPATASPIAEAVPQPTLPPEPTQPAPGAPAPPEGGAGGTGGSGGSNSPGQAGGHVPPPAPVLHDIPGGDPTFPPLDGEQPGGPGVPGGGGDTGNPTGGDTPLTPGGGPSNPDVPVPVPEPGSMILFVTGVGAFAVRRLRRRS